MVQADVFLRALLRFSTMWLSSLSEFSQGDFLAACGGEMRSD